MIIFHKTDVNLQTDLLANAHKLPLVAEREYIGENV